MRRMRLIAGSSALILLILIARPGVAPAQVGRIGLHALRIEPRGEAKDLSDPSYGGGIEVIAPLGETAKIAAVALGFEYAQFDSETLVYKPDAFSFRRELTTTQDYMRVYLGVQLGPHGHGFFQPYIGLNGSLVRHALSQTLEEPDDVNPDNTRTQTASQSDWGVGYDVTGGVNLHFMHRFNAYGGVRYLRSHGLNEPLGPEGLTVDPEYLQVFLGLAVSVYAEDFADE